MNLYQLIKALAEAEPMYIVSLDMSKSRWYCMFCNPVQGNHEPECPVNYAKTMLLALGSVIPPEMLAEEAWKEQNDDRGTTRMPT